MMRVAELTPEFVDTFPSPLQYCVLYVSIGYRTTGHLCCCGCGEEVIAPLAPAQWTLTFDGDTVSLHPSIGNWTLPCRSHYVIRRNRVFVRRTFTPEEITDNRVSDRALLNRYLDGDLGHDVSTDMYASNPVDVATTTKRRRWRFRMRSGRR